MLIVKPPGHCRAQFYGPLQNRYLVKCDITGKWYWYDGKVFKPAKNTDVLEALLIRIENESLEYEQEK